MTDLHARLLAEIERRDQVATTADKYCPAPWVLGTQQVIDDDGDSVVFAYEDVVAHVALHDPADALRRYTHYRRILNDHATITNCEGERVCPSCGWLGVLTRPDACDELAALADALGIPIEEPATDG